MTTPARTALAALAALLTVSSALAQGYICADGGGSSWNNPANDAMVAWMLQKAGHGEVVVLGSIERSPDEPDAVADAFRRAGAAGVRALVITHRNADDPDVAAEIARARVVWIRGGDQSRYVRGWKGTATHSAIRQVFDSGGVVGGTSAGAAVLGEVVYDARVGSLRPEQALADAAHPNLTLAEEFLDLVPGVLFDSHFTERGRIARLPLMLARARREMAKDVLGIGLDTRTALCVGPDGVAEVIGEGAVTILALTDDTREELEPGRPPTITHIRMTQLIAGHRYDLRRRRVLSRPEEGRPRATDEAAEGKWIPLQIDGGRAADALLSRLTIAGGDDPAAIHEGALTIAPRPTGSTQPWLPRTFIVTRAWSEPRFIENRVGGMLFGMAKYPGWRGLCVGEGCRVSLSADGVLSVEAADPRAARPTSALLLTGDGVTGAIAEPPGAGGGAGAGKRRQAVAMDGVVLHVLGAGWSADLAHGTIERTAELVR